MSDLFKSDHVKAALYITDLGHYLVKIKNDRTKAVAVKNVREEEVRVAFTRINADSGWLPSGVVRAGNSVQGPFFVYYQGRTVQTIHFEDESSASYLLPATVLIGFKDKYYLFALEKGGFSNKSMAFHAPWPNVYESGRICWGTNEKPRIDPATADKAWSLFFESRFNGDLASGKSREFPQDVRKQIQKIDSCDPYPLEDMVSTRKTIEAITNDLIGEGDE